MRKGFVLITCPKRSSSLREAEAGSQTVQASQRWESRLTLDRDAAYWLIQLLSYITQDYLPRVIPPQRSGLFCIILIINQEDAPQARMMVAVPQQRFPFLSYIWVYVQLTENQPAHCQFPLWPGN